MSSEVLVQKMNWGRGDSETLPLLEAIRLRQRWGSVGGGYPKTLSLQMDGGTCIILDMDVRIYCGCVRNSCKSS